MSFVPVDFFWGQHCIAVLADRVRYRCALSVAASTAAIPFDGGDELTTSFKDQFYLVARRFECGSGPILECCAAPIRCNPQSNPRPDGRGTLRKLVGFADRPFSAPREILKRLRRRHAPSMSSPDAPNTPTAPLHTQPGSIG